MDYHAAGFYVDGGDYVVEGGDEDFLGAVGDDVDVVAACFHDLGDLAQGFALRGIDFHVEELEVVILALGEGRDAVARDEYGDATQGFGVCHRVYAVQLQDDPGIMPLEGVFQAVLLTREEQDFTSGKPVWGVGDGLDLQFAGESARSEDTTYKNVRL